MYEQLYFLKVDVVLLGVHPPSVCETCRFLNFSLKWHPFRDLKLKFVGSRRQEQLSSRCQQRVVATAEESVLRTEMAGLESQEEAAPQGVLFYKPMGWLGQIRPHRRDESWSVSQVQDRRPGRSFVYLFIP